MRPRFSAQAFAVLVLGAIAIVIITAILASAVTTAQLAGDLKTATGQLRDIKKADAAAEQARVERSAAVNKKLATLQRQNAQQAARDRQQRAYLARLSRALRMHGIPVPNPPRATVTPSPKGPRPTHRATPGHTAPSPRSQRSTDPLTPCSLLPALCPFLSGPTLLP